MSQATASYWEIYMPHFKAAAALFGMEVIPAMTHDMAEFEALGCLAQAHRAEWWPDPDAGWLPARKSNGNHSAGGSPPVTCGLLDPCFHPGGRLVVLRK